MILLDPKLFLEAIEIDFEKYIKAIKDSRNKEERDKFQNYWKKRYE